MGGPHEEFKDAQAWSIMAGFCIIDLICLQANMKQSATSQDNVSYQVHPVTCPLTSLTSLSLGSTAIGSVPELNWIAAVRLETTGQGTGVIQTIIYDHDHHTYSCLAL